jgi:RNA recognition motif-containing protein
MAEYSGTRLYLGNLHKDGRLMESFFGDFFFRRVAKKVEYVLICSAARKQEVEDFFKEGGGNIVEVKLMNGFGFIQYDSEADAKDVVPGISLPLRYRFLR